MIHKVTTLVALVITLALDVTYSWNGTPAIQTGYPVTVSSFMNGYDPSQLLLGNNTMGWCAA